MTTSESLCAGFDGMSKNAVCESREVLSTTSESPLMTAESANLGPLEPRLTMTKRRRGFTLLSQERPLQPRLQNPR
jgi:hypothetical protein